MNVVLSKEIRRFRAAFDHFHHTGVSIAPLPLADLIRSLNTFAELAEELEAELRLKDDETDVTDGLQAGGNVIVLPQLSARKPGGAR